MCHDPCRDAAGHASDCLPAATPDGPSSSGFGRMGLATGPPANTKTTALPAFWAHSPDSLHSASARLVKPQLLEPLSIVAFSPCACVHLFTHSGLPSCARAGTTPLRLDHVKSFMRIADFQQDPSRENILLARLTAERARISHSHGLVRECMPSVCVSGRRCCGLFQVSLSARSVAGAARCSGPGDSTLRCCVAAFPAMRYALGTGGPHSYGCCRRRLASGVVREALLEAYSGSRWGNTLSSESPVLARLNQQTRRHKCVRLLDVRAQVLVEGVTRYSGDVQIFCCELVARNSVLVQRLGASDSNAMKSCTP